MTNHPAETAAATSPAPKLIRSHCVPGGPFGQHAHLWSGPLSFFVPGDPRPQPRHRARVIPNHKPFGTRCRCGRWYTATMYLPEKDIEDGERCGEARAWKERVALFGRRVQPARPLQGPIAISLSFFSVAPEYVLEWAARGQITLPCLKPTLPDCDNLTKAVLDAMSDAAWWRHDGQIAWPLTPKWWVAREQPEGVLIEVWHLPQPEPEKERANAKA